MIGTVTTAGGVIEVQTRDAGKVALAKESIAFLRSREEQIAYEAEIERRRNPRWLGTVDAGLSTTRGNAETIVVSLGTQAARTTPADNLSVYAASLFARNSTSGTALTTAQALRGGARYDRNINE